MLHSMPSQLSLIQNIHYLPHVLWSQMDVAESWGLIYPLTLQPWAPWGQWWEPRASGAGAQAASDLVPGQTHHPASAVQEAAPSFVPSTTQVLQLEVRGLSAPGGCRQGGWRVRELLPWMQGTAVLPPGELLGSAPRRDWRRITHLD